jgi:anti-anti-sigma regulatory factor
VIDDFTATARSSPTGVVLDITGELDAVTAPQALHTIGTIALRPGQLLIVDLSGREGNSCCQVL